MFDQVVSRLGNEHLSTVSGTHDTSGVILTTQKERAEKLLHQLEESNAQLERAHTQLRSYASEVEELTIIRERTHMAADDTAS